MEGAPFAVGDPIVVNGQDGTVEAIGLLPQEQRFGVRWVIEVTTHAGLVLATCDDDGRNHNVTHRVSPSTLVAA